MEIILIFLFGLFIGSFLGVLSDRLPKGETLMGRSRCDYCKKTLQWYDLIPIVSFVWQGGKCRYCHKKLSKQYIIIELVTGMTLVISYWLLVIMQEGIQYSVFSIQEVNNYKSFYLLPFTFYVVVASSLIVIFFADVKYRIIPDEMLIILFITSLIINYYQKTVLDNFIAAIVLCSMFYALYFITRGKGIGFGDVKLAGIIGWLMGPALGAAAVYFGFILGGIFGIGLLLSGKAKMKSKIAFGPFLIIGMVFAFIFHTQINIFINSLF